MKLLRVIFVIVVLFGGVAVLTSGAPNAAARPSPTPKPDLRIGSEFIGDDGWHYSVRQSDVSKTVTIVDGTFPSVYTADGSFITVLIRLTNLTKQGSTTLREDSFELRDSRGIRYAPTRITRLYAREGYHELGQAFTPTVPSLVQLYFDVAPGATGLRLRLVKFGVDIRLE